MYGQVKGKVTAEGAAFPGLAFDSKFTSMAIQNVLDDGKSQACASRLSRATRVDAIESLRETWYVNGRNAFPGIAD